MSLLKGKKILGLKFFENKISTQSICSKIRARRNDDEENTTKLVLGMIIAEQLEKFITQHIFEIRLFVVIQVKVRTRVCVFLFQCVAVDKHLRVC